MKLKIPIYIAIAIASIMALLGGFSLVHGQTVCYPQDGCTGTATIPSYGQLLVGNANGTYSLMATSSLGITSSSGSGAAFPFTPTLNFGLNTSATSTPLWARLGFFASSTSRFDYASSTIFSSSGLSYFSNILNFFGQDLYIFTQDEDEPRDVNILGGTPTTGSGNTGGDINLTAGGGSDQGSTGGSINMTSGAANLSYAQADGGDFLFQGGVGRGVSQQGGDMTLQSGNGASSASGGDITLKGGLGNSTGDGGSIFLQSGGTGSGLLGTIDFYHTNTAASNLIATFKNSKFGIGTSTPYAPLSVVGQVVGSYFTSTSTTNKSTFPYASTTGLTISGSASSSQLRLDRFFDLAETSGSEGTPVSGLRITVEDDGGGTKIVYGTDSLGNKASLGGGGGGGCTILNCNTDVTLTTNASSSVLTYNGSQWVDNILDFGWLTGVNTVAKGGTGSSTPSGLLYGDGAGSIITAIGDTHYQVPLNFSTGLQRSGNGVLCRTASPSQFGCLATSVFSAFNNKISSSSISATGINTWDSATGVIGTNLAANVTWTGVHTFDQLPQSSVLADSANDLVNFQTLSNFLQGVGTTVNADYATTSPVTKANMYNGNMVIDGHTVVTGDRIGLFGQAAAAENGIWVVKTASNAPDRATNYNETNEADRGSLVSVLGGASLINSLWVQTTDDPTIDSSSLVFARLPASTVYTASKGLQLSGSDFQTRLLSNGGLYTSGTLGSEGLGILHDNTTLATSTGFLGIKTGGVGESQIADGAISLIGSKIAGILGLANGGTATSTFFDEGVVFSDGNKLTQDTSFRWASSTNLLTVPYASTTALTAGNLAISGLTSGSIPYIGANGNVLQNNSNLAWNNTATRLSVPYASTTYFSTVGLAVTGQSSGCAQFGSNGALTSTGSDCSTGGGGSGGSGGSGTPMSLATTTYKNIAEQITASANTLQNDDELFFTIGSNETWNYRFALYANIPTQPDMQVTVTTPVGSTCNYHTINTTGDTSGTVSCGTGSGIIVGNGTTDLVEVVGSVRNGSTAGQIRLQWAKNTANAGTLEVGAGSYVTAISTTTIRGLTIGGSDTQVQYNDNGILNGDSGLTFNKTADRLTSTYASTTALTVSGGFYLGDTSIGTGCLTRQSNGTLSATGQACAASLWQGSGTQIYYDNGGANTARVGINTAGPSATLDLVGVAGDNDAQGSVDASAILTTSGGAGGSFNYNGTGSTVGGIGGALTLTAGEGGDINDIDTLYSITGGTGGAINLISGGGGDANNGSSNTAGNGGLIVLQGGAGGNGDVAGSYGNIAMQTNGGNVGIGLNNPGSKLEIASQSIGVGTYALEISGTGSAAYGRMGFIPNSGLVSGVIERGSAGTLYFGEVGDTGGYQFRGTGATYIQGKLGVGSTTPLHTAVIESTTEPTLRISPGTSGSVDPMLWLSDSYSSYTAAGYKQYYDNDVGSTYFDNMFANATGDMFFRVRTASTPVNAFTIDGAAGHAGFSTTTPYANLTVEQDTTLSSFIVGNQGSTSPALDIAGVNGNGHIGIATSSKSDYLITIATQTDGDGLRVDGTTASPSYALSRKSTIYSTYGVANDNGAFSNIATANDTVLRCIGSSDCIIDASVNGDIKLGTGTNGVNSVTRLTVANAGDIDICNGACDTITNTGAGNLYVEGKIEVDGLVTGGTGTALCIDANGTIFKDGGAVLCTEAASPFFTLYKDGKMIEDIEFSANLNSKDKADYQSFNLTNWNGKNYEIVINNRKDETDYIDTVQVILYGSWEDQKQGALEYYKLDMTIEDENASWFKRLFTKKDSKTLAKKDGKELVLEKGEKVKVTLEDLPEGFTVHSAVLKTYGYYIPYPEK